MRQNAASDLGIHCLLRECSFKILIKMKNTTQQPLKPKWTGPIDNREKSIRLKWVNQTVQYLIRFRIVCCSKNNNINHKITLPWRNASLVVGKLRPSARPSANLLGCLVCAICRSMISFHTIIFKLCMMVDVHLIFCAHFMTIFSFCGVLNLTIFHSKMLRLCLVFLARLIEISVVFTHLEYPFQPVDI